MSGIYIFFKYITSPFLYLARKAGFKSTFPKYIDSKINRSILPLTESPDTIQRNDILPILQTGDSLPALSTILSNGSSDIYENYSKSPLLLMFIRGSWCPYSRLHFTEINSNKELFEKSGIKLLAVTAYNDQEWWQSKGINIPMIIDKNGILFRQFGLLVNSWIEFAWGRILPHEGALLFDQNGKLIASDVRKINNLLPGQRFLSSDRWIEIFKSNQSNK